MPIPFSEREILETFVESVDELLDSSYLKQARAGGVGSSVSVMRGIGVVMGRSAPDRDSVKATLLTIRFFCQNREPTSLENMSTLVQGLPVDQALKDRFVQARTEFNKHLQAEPVVKYPPGAAAEKNGQIFDTFLYGQYAHANPDKKRTVQAWRGQSYFHNLCSQFDLTLLHFISALAIMRQVVVEIIKGGAV